MKRHGLSILALALALLTTAAVAQNTGAILRADVPFAFVAGKQVIPAGQVVVRETGINNNTLWVGNDDAKSGTLLIPNRSESLRAAGQTMLVFHKYGNQYFLAGVEREGDQSGYAFPTSTTEKELRAQKASQPEEIQLAAN